MSKQKITREMALGVIEARKIWISGARTRCELSRLAEATREDLDFMLDFRLISPEEKLQQETEVSAVVQERLMEIQSCTVVRFPLPRMWPIVDTAAPAANLAEQE